MSHTILAFAEQRDGTLKKSAFEVVTAAAALAKKLGGAKVVAVVIATQAIGNAGELGAFGADEVVLATGDAFAGYAPGAYARALKELCEQRGASALLLPHSAQGKDLAPRLSALLLSPLVADCVALDVDGGAIVARRPVYAGKAFWTVKPKGGRFLATLRPNVFTPAKSGGAPVSPTSWQPSAQRAPRVVLKSVIAPEGSKSVELTEADVIVSGGRGMKGPEHFAMLEELAGALGAAVGASRAVVDAGWRPHGDQVGQTGKTVSPNLYIACGISGAIQHLAGMSSSRVIVAINKDKEAPIFKLATYGIVGDVFEVVPALTAEIRKAKGT
ncbi:MAG: electron transfer flavoprotein subunit alpha/FixB family protein [Planctomycetes bacterium]|nr:electron transfer flavoprotein subunit alpha/FixB family protein [Planctomycetota bacterium]